MLREILTTGFQDKNIRSEKKKKIVPTDRTGISTTKKTTQDYTFNNVISGSDTPQGNSSPIMGKQIESIMNKQDYLSYQNLESTSPGSLQGNNFFTFKEINKNIIENNQPINEENEKNLNDIDNNGDEKKNNEMIIIPGSYELENNIIDNNKEESKDSKNINTENQKKIFGANNVNINTGNYNSNNNTSDRNTNTNINNSKFHKNKSCDLLNKSKATESSNNNNNLYNNGNASFSMLTSNGIDKLKLLEEYISLIKNNGINANELKIQQLQKQKDKLQNKISILSNNIKQFQKITKNNINVKRNLEQEKEFAKKYSDKADKDANGLKKILPANRANIDTMKNQIAQTREETEYINNYTVEIERQTMEIQDEIKKFNGLISNLNKDKEKIMGEIKIYRKKCENLGNKIERVEKSSNDFMENVQELVRMTNQK